MAKRLRIDNALELFQAKQEGRPPIAEVEIDELPPRFEATVLERPSELVDEGQVYDGREP
jgi:hypothetical protein